jgi:hypothetical protein
VQKIVGLTFTLLVFAGAASAQLPGGNIFVGYSYTGGDVFSNNCNPGCPAIAFLQPPSRSSALNGFDGSLEGKFLPWIGIVADLSRQYGSEDFTRVCIIGPPACSPGRVTVHSTLSSVMFGPRVSVPIGRLTPFAHALIGVSHIHDSGAVSNSDTAFATAIGGGVDYKLIKGLAWRVQGEEFHTRFFGSTQDHFRFSTGIVLRF